MLVLILAQNTACLCDKVFVLIHAVQHNRHCVSLKLGKIQITNYEGSDHIYNKQLVYSSHDEKERRDRTPEMVLPGELKCIAPYLLRGAESFLRR